MKKKFLAVITTLVMAGSGVTGALMHAPAASAASEDPYAVEKLEGAVDTEQNNYMTDSQYKKLFGVDLNSKDIDAFDPDNTDNPLEGYEPSVLSELFLGYMNRDDHYDGKFAVMENASGDSGFDINNMWNTNYGGVTNYYGERDNEDVHTHAISTVALTPGDLTDEDAYSRQQILIENRLWLEEDGFAREDNTHRMLSTYTLGGNGWVRNECKDIYLSDDNWACQLGVPEQQGYTAMAVGDYDGDNYNEVAAYVPSNDETGTMAQIEIYQPEKSGDVYNLKFEYSLKISEIAGRFNVWDEQYHAYVHLSTTEMAGRDDLVINVTQPFWSEEEFTENGAIAIYSFQGGNKKQEFSSSLAYDGYRFKMSASANADLDGDGKDELVVGGFKNTGYDKDSRGSISDSEYLVNVVFYDNGRYMTAWTEPQATMGINLYHERKNDSPVAIAAGKYRMGAVTDTVFLEGTYLDFVVGNGDTAREKFESGKFIQNPSESMSGMSDATINLGASGTFVSDKPGNEEVVIYATYGSSSVDNVDVDIIWGHPGEDGKVATNKTNDNYINNRDEADGVTFSMCPVNVDQDTSMIKYKGKTVGWSNPVVYGILMSMPYWQEMDYGDTWNARGQTDFGITKSKEDGTTVTAGVDVGVTVNISGEATVFGNGVGAGIDIGPVGSYAYENTESKSLSKGVTWSAGAGQDSVALMVMPVVTYEYDVIMPEHEATKEEQAAGKSGTIAELAAPLACTTTFEPVITDLPIDTYNDVIEEFNAMAEASGNGQDKLPLIDLEEIYAGAKTGDPSSYASNPEDISSLKGEEGKDYHYVGEVHAQTGKDKSVETLSIEAVSSSSESNGFTAGLKTSVMGKVIGGLDFMSIVSATGSIGVTVDSQVTGGKTWISTESTGITYSGAFANLPSEAEGYGYEYSAGLVKWNADLEGFDQELEVEGTDEVLPDKTIVIGPTVSMLDAATPPAVPTNLHVLGVTTDSAVLEWTNPKGKRAPDHYKIYYSKDNTNYYPLEGTVDGSESTHVVTGLNADSEYYFRLEGYDKDTSLRSVLSAPVATKTKSGSEPVIITHPVDRYAKVGEKALFNIEAKAQTEGNTISYQWQKLTEGDYGISWSDINVASDSTIGKTGEFNAAYASPDGTIRAEDVDDLNGNVYRCIVAEHQAGKLDYTETVSNSATLHVGDKVLATERVLKIEGSSHGMKSDNELLVGAGDDINVSAVLTDHLGKVLSNYSVKFALLDKNQNGKCIEYIDGSTDSEGKVSVSFENLAAGSYEITAIVKKNDSYRITVSNSIQLTVNESYSIIYELNGGINHNLNPLSYASGSKYILLRDASREGYEFTGWYLDSGLKNKVETKWLDVSELDGILTLYAGWEEIEDDPAGPGTPDDGKTDEDAGGTADGNGGSDGGAGAGDDATGTGDDMPLAAAAAVLIAALGGAAAVLFGRRRTE